MKYFCRPSREAAEASYIPPAFGKTYEPFGTVSIGPDSVIGTDGVDLVELGGEWLAIHPETASWAFLSRGELDAFSRLNRVRFGDVERLWPSSAALPMHAFAAHLYRRGLVTIDGCTAVDEGMFAESGNYNEGHLVELLLTERCNLACPYCLAGASKSMPSMDWEIARKSVDLAFAMREADTLAFEFAGGEPFLQFPLMKRLASYIHQHPERHGRTVFLSIQTNATLLTAERVEWLKENDIRVGISVDGDPDSQNGGRPQVNGRESFSLLMRGIELLKQHEVPFGALVVLNRHNAHSPDRLIEFLLANRIHGFRLNPVAYIGDARKNWLDVGLTQEEIVGYFKALMSAIATRGHMLLEDNIRSMCDFLTSKQRRTRCMRSACGAGDTFQAVAANGDIYPCGRATQSPGLKLGNINDPAVGSLSAPARHHPQIVQIRGRRPENLEGCPTCSYRQLCQAGCSAQAFERYGTVRHRTPECTFYKTLYPHLMRWLSFDGPAFDHLNASSYFGFEGQRIDFDFAQPDLVAAVQ
jgi:radical SAM protein with 4Fe4S-binding SPASM domain